MAIGGVEVTEGKHGVGIDARRVVALDILRVGAGRIHTVIEHGLNVVVLHRVVKRLVVVLHAVHHLGVGHLGAGPVAHELLVVVGGAPDVVVDVLPLGIARHRVFQIDGDAVGHKLGLNLVLAGADVLHRTANQQTGLEGHLLVDVDIGAAGNLFAVARGGVAAIGGVDNLGTAGSTDGNEFGTLLVAQFILSAGQVNPSDLGAVLEQILVVVATQDLGETAQGVGAGGLADAHGEFTLGALHGHREASRCAGLQLIGAHVVDTGQLAGRAQGLNLLLVGFPVGIEHTRRAGHSQQVSVGGNGVLLDRVKRVAGVAVLSVVVLDKRHGVATILAALIALADEGPVAIVLSVEFAHIAVVEGVAANVAELEVKGRARAAGAVNPTADGARTAPVLAHAELRLGVLVVHLGVTGRVAAHHVITEAGVAVIVDEHIEVVLDGVLHVGALVVKVTLAAPVLAGVEVGTQRLALLQVLGRLAAVIIAADVLAGHQVGLAVVGLLHKVGPVGRVLAVVDNNVGDGADAVILEGLDHRAEFILVAKRTVVVVEPVLGVVTHRLAAAVGTLRYPHQVESLGQVVDIGLKRQPTCLAVTVPVETLKHHAAIVGGPALRPHHGRQRSGCNQSSKFLHKRLMVIIVWFLYATNLLFFI